MAEKIKVNYIDHISIAVKDLEKAVQDYQNIFGWEVDGRYTDTSEKIRVAYFKVGDTAYELMEDIDGTGEVARFIKHFGEGVMLVSFNVDSCIQSHEQLNRNSARLLDQKPRFAKELNRYFSFIHPKNCHGVLTEIIDGKY
jgi:methylmalonyl-CoA/ethylmalonyl-CoA epimerase